MGRGGAGSGAGRSGGGHVGGGSRGGSGRISSGSRGGYHSPSSHHSSSSHQSYSGGHHYTNSVHHYHHGGGGYGYGYRRGNQIASAIATVSVLLILMIALVLTFNSGGFGGNVTFSTVAREPLEGKYVTTTAYYEDHIGWVESSSRLEKGMKKFYKETGVQPYLYLAETIDGIQHPSVEQIADFSENLYGELFEDEGHLLVVFQEYNEDSRYAVYCVSGTMAKTVVDAEARDILMDYIDHYYTSDLDTSDFFSTSFEGAAKRMMDKTTSPVVYIAVFGGASAILFIAFVWWKKAKKQKNLEAEQTERILSQPVEKLVDTDTDELLNKYSGGDSQ